MISLRSLGPVIGLTLLLASLSSSAAGQEPSAPDTHIAQGEALFEAENYDAALAEFQAAYDLLGDEPQRYYLLWNIGQCHERLFRYDRALDYYQRYLDEGGPDAEDRATVEATMRALSALLGTIHVDTNVEGAELWVDDTLVGTAPGDLRVTGGRHTIELRATGYATATVEVQIAARGERSERIMLDELAGDSRIDPTWCVLSGGIAVVALGVASGFWAYAQDQFNATGGYDFRDGAQERIDQAALTGDVLLGTAALFAVTSVVLGFFTRWDTADAPAVHALILPSPEGVTLSVGGTL